MLTVFTPAYNRAGMLPRLYQSLCEQTNKDFEWLIIDDGSTDETTAVIQSFADEQKLNIRYYKKENGGKHTAHNLALELAAGEWFLCVDSDDLLAADAVAKLVEKFAKLNEEKGVIAYKEDLNGTLLSDPFPEEIQKAQMYRLASDYGCRGEFSLAFQTAFAREFPFPVFAGERFVTESVIYDQMDQHGQFALLPAVLTLCEYQQDGYSSDATKLMKKNPSGYCLYFLQRIDLHRSVKQRIVHAGKYWCFRWICKRSELRYQGNHKILVAVSVIPGIFFRVYYKLFRRI